MSDKGINFANLISEYNTMKGLFNKVISINLTNWEHEILEIPDDVYIDYLGGRGLGAKLFTSIHGSVITGL